MAVKIRLTRVGKKKVPFYRVIVSNATSPRDGKFIEKLGTYDPRAEKDSKWNINIEKAFSWIKNGAQPTEIVNSYLKSLAQK